VESRIEKAAGATKPDKATIKGKIIDFGWQLKKNGYSEGTIKQYMWILMHLVKLGSDILNADSVKEVIAQQQAWSKARKKTVAAAYTKFLQTYGMTWIPPKCKVTRKIPFIPTQEELNTLISGTGKKTSTFLQLLMETAMRAGEGKSLLWTDIDFEKRLITLNQPEKGGNPRIWKVSPKLIAMLNALPRKNLKVFGDSSMNSSRTTFLKARKRLAAKLQNPRLLKISFHTLRHWKATMLYHETKDPFYVKEFLGHKKLDTTLLYIQIEKALFKEINDDFIVKVAKNPKEIKALLEVGFGYVCQKDDLLYFRKRK